jgi:hypothetical protein
VIGWLIWRHVCCRQNCMLHAILLRTTVRLRASMKAGPAQSRSAEKRTIASMAARTLGRCSPDASYCDLACVGVSVQASGVKLHHLFRDVLHSDAIPSVSSCCTVLRVNYCMAVSRLVDANAPHCSAPQQTSCVPAAALLRQAQMAWAAPTGCGIARCLHLSAGMRRACLCQIAAAAPHSLAASVCWRVAALGGSSAHPSRLLPRRLRGSAVGWRTCFHAPPAPD